MIKTTLQFQFYEEVVVARTFPDLSHASVCSRAQLVNVFCAGDLCYYHCVAVCVSHVQRCPANIHVHKL